MGGIDPRLRRQPDRDRRQPGRTIAVGRKNYLFAGSDRAAERAAALYTPIKTAKLDGQSPEAYQRDVLTRFAAHPNKCLVGFLPWNWSPALAAARPT